MAGNDPAMSSEKQSFFDHLSFDIRVMIYDHLDAPFVSGEATGFICSCRQARHEFGEVDSRRINKNFAHMELIIEERTGFSVSIPRVSIEDPLTAQHDISVELPFELLDRDREWIRFIFLRHLINPVLAVCRSTVEFTFATCKREDSLGNLVRILDMHSITGLLNIHIGAFWNTILGLSIQNSVKLGYMSQLLGAKDSVRSLPQLKRVTISLLPNRAECVVLA